MPVVTRRKNIQFQLSKVYSGYGCPWPQAYVESKLDGLRGAVNVDEGVALTRTGLLIPNADLVIAELQKSRSFKGMVIDGEFMAKDWNLSQSIVKSQSLHPEREKLRLNAFDCLSCKEWDRQVCERPLFERKLDLFNRWGGSMKLTDYVQHEKATSEADIKRLLKKYLALGYEGIMLKNPHSFYAFRKHDSWLKYKLMIEADLTIMAAAEGLGKYAGTLGSVMVSGAVEHNGLTYPVDSEAGMGKSVTDAVRDNLWKLHKAGKLVGQLAETYFQEITEDGALRFPKFFRLRDDK